MLTIFQFLLLHGGLLSAGLPMLGDLCRRDNPCITNATCVIDPAAPIIGRPFCVCPPGYEGDGRTDGSGCTDIDECQTQTHDCLPGAEICRNQAGSYQCACEPGYALLGRDRHCRDINECLDPGICGDSEASCVNLPGTYTCACADPLREYHNGKCIPKNFCADPDFNRCDPVNGLCFNGADGPECLCKAGFELAGDQNTCVDIDECARGEHNCPEDIAECINEAGSYHCECSERKGWTNASSKECTNLNECEQYPDVCGSELSCCKDLPPPRKFVCSPLIHDASEMYTESFSPFLGPMALMSQGANNLKRKWQRTAEEFTLFAHGGPQRHLVAYRAPNVAPSQVYDPNADLYYYAGYPRQLAAMQSDHGGPLQGVADNLMRYTIEAAAHVVPSLNGLNDEGVCPYGFIDLRPLQRRSSLQRMPETSNKVFNWLRDASPIKLREVENVDPAAVAVGLAHNAKNVFDQMSEWYKSFSVVPAALENMAESLNITPGKDITKWLGLLNKSAQPFKDTVATIKNVVGNDDRQGSQNLYELPVGV